MSAPENFDVTDKDGDRVIVTFSDEPDAQFAVLLRTHRGSDHYGHPAGLTLDQARDLRDRLTVLLGEDEPGAGDVGATGPHVQVTASPQPAMPLALAEAAADLLNTFLGKDRA